MPDQNAVGGNDPVKKVPADGDYEFEHWKGKEELRIKREELELKRQELTRTRWSSPVVVALIGLTASVLVSMVQNFLQNKASRDLERQRFESTLIQKALDTDSAEEAVKRLKLDLELGFITDQNRKIAAYINNPNDIPLQPTIFSECANIKSITDCPDEGCGSQIDPLLNKRKNIRADNQAPVLRKFDWMRTLPSPTRFSTENRNRTELAELGEGQKITIVALAISVKRGGRESCNCELTAVSDTDNTIVLVDPNTTEASLEVIEQESETAEFTPRVRLDHPNFTREMLQPRIEATGGRLLVRITGLLLFDSAHLVGHPLKRHNNWEIHPVLKLEYCPAGPVCQGNSNANWRNLDDD